MTLHRPEAAPSRDELTRARQAVATATRLREHVVQTSRSSARLWEASRMLHESCRLSRARRLEASYRRGMAPQGRPIVGFRVEGRVGDQHVFAVWEGGLLACDPRLRQQAELLVQLEEVFVGPGTARCYLASLQGPPVAVLLTLVRACDRVEQVTVELPEG